MKKELAAILAAASISSADVVMHSDYIPKYQAYPGAPIKPVISITFAEKEAGIGSTNAMSNFTDGSKKYTIQSCTNLSEKTWKTIETLEGTGSRINVIYTAIGSQALYRVIKQ